MCGYVQRIRDDPLSIALEEPQSSYKPVRVERSTEGLRGASTKSGGELGASSIRFVFVRALLAANTTGRQGRGAEWQAHITKFDYTYLL